MTRLRTSLLLSLAIILLAVGASAGPRDAAAVIAHCGQATLNDTTVLGDHTVAGGHRSLKYLTGTLNFDRVQNDGWTFTSGAHGKKTDLSAAEMAHYMPCLADALAASNSAEPLKPVTTGDRVAASMRRPYEKLIAISILVLVVLTAAYFIQASRSRRDEDDE